MSKRVYKGMLSIIPNMPEDTLRQMKKFSWYESTLKKMRRFYGQEFDADGPMVDVRIEDPGDPESSWCDHGWPGAAPRPKLHELSEEERSAWREQFYFPKWIPAELLQGVKEGQELILTIDGGEIEIHLIADQQHGRYRDGRTFEDTFTERMGVWEAYEKGEDIYVGIPGMFMTKVNKNRM